MSLTYRTELPIMYTFLTSRTFVVLLNDNSEIRVALSHLNNAQQDLITTKCYHKTWEI